MTTLGWLQEIIVRSAAELIAASYITQLIGPW